MLSSIMLNVVMLNVANNPFMLSVVMLNVVMLSVANNPFMLSVVMLNVVMLSVMAPKLVHTRARARAGSLHQRPAEIVMSLRTD